jgi:hypothetical protein
MHAHWKKIALAYGGIAVVLYFLNQKTWGVTDGLFWPKTLLMGASGQ